eukprot:892986-Amphidinium_carterae.1
MISPAVRRLIIASASSMPARTARGYSFNSCPVKPVDDANPSVTLRFGFDVVRVQVSSHFSCKRHPSLVIVNIAWRMLVSNSKLGSMPWSALP